MNNIVNDIAMNWWMAAKAKGADYIRIVKPRRYFALEACKRGAKERISQLSLTTADKTVAQNTRSRLLVLLDSREPDIVVGQYNQHKLRMAECCQGDCKYERLYESRIKTEKTNASRLKAHLLPFCEENRIHDIRDLYRREIIGKYIIYLQETVKGIDTAKAVIKTTKAFLNWYDSTQKSSLIDRNYIEAFANYSRKLGYKQRTTKPFLSDEQCRQILATKIVDSELYAMIVSHLVGGLRDIEVQGLRWRDLNAKEGWVKVVNSKGSVARYAQFPKVMQEAFSAIQRTRLHNTLGNDYVFTQSSYGVRNDKIKMFICKIVGVSGRDYGSNCLRRTGCATINYECPGLGDKQLGHAVNSRVTEMHYSNPRDFRNINRFWDDLWASVKAEGLHLVNLSDDLTNVISIRA